MGQCRQIFNTYFLPQQNGYANAQQCPDIRNVHDVISHPVSMDCNTTNVSPNFQPSPGNPKHHIQFPIFPLPGQCQTRQRFCTPLTPNPFMEVINRYHQCVITFSSLALASTQPKPLLPNTSWQHFMLQLTDRFSHSSEAPISTRTDPYTLAQIRVSSILFKLHYH